ncbi:MAG: Flp pilus assembly complex ATPase component TadA, partial [Kiritimatiellae bacterium]|nr:Flp pilus assembly complex ATPase component TadA [Kiritimatiellia bacterium]
LLASSGEDLTLETLGMDEGQLKSVVEVLSSPHGLFLLTGPTGSGKTTTLYAAIRRMLADRALNVLTVEDPVEYEIEGAVQCEVDAADKVNFSKALRSLLRHDPDVVMIGEIRDGESLDVAVKAALTGHLVLSTLHTNDAIGAVTRLRDMGLENHLAAATLRMSIAQRLVRRVCRGCGGGGCLSCAGRGYFGRIALFELFRPDGDLSRLIAEGANEATIRAAAVAAGFRTLADDAARKVADGATTDAEVAKAL